VVFAELLNVTGTSLISRPAFEIDGLFQQVRLFPSLFSLSQKLAAGIKNQIAASMARSCSARISAGSVRVVHRVRVVLVGNVIDDQ
jgi:hypothetical protein